MKYHYLFIQFITSQCSNYGSKCPSWAPCCKGGWCSDDPSFCKAGCDTKNSFSEDSCQPRFYCKDIDEEFDNYQLKNENHFSGNPEEGELVSKFIPDYAKVENGNLVLQLKFDDRPNEVGKTQGFGSTVETSRYMEYGKITARIKTGSKESGIVSSLITRSPEGDEIDFEWVGKDNKATQTNFYFDGNIDYTKMVKANGTFDTSTDYHIYEIDWKPDYIHWSVDGKVVRELLKKDTFDKVNNKFLFPDKSSLVGIGIWDGGRGLQGTVEWAGPTNWDDKNKVHSMYVDWIKIDCFYKGNETTNFTNKKGKNGKVNVHNDINNKSSSSSLFMVSLSLLLLII